MITELLLKISKGVNVLSFFRLNGRSRNKYKNQKVYVDGIKFDSQREANRYKQLKSLEKNNFIKNLRRQVIYELVPKQAGERAVKYIADFVYTQDGETVVEDVKGFKTDAYIIKRKLMLYKYNIKIKEI